MWLGFPSLVPRGLSPWGARCWGHKEEHRSGGGPWEPCTSPRPRTCPSAQVRGSLPAAARPAPVPAGRVRGCWRWCTNHPTSSWCHPKPGSRKGPLPSPWTTGQEKGILPENCSLPKCSNFFFFSPNSGKCPNLHLQSLLGDARAAAGSSRCVGDAAGWAGTRRRAAAPGAVGAQLGTRSPASAPTGPQRRSGPQLGVALPHPSRLSLAWGSGAVGPAGGAQEEPSPSLPFPALPRLHGAVRPGLAVQSPAFHSSGPT